MCDPVTAWQCHLTENLLPLIETGTAHRLPNDAVAVSSAVIRLGVELAAQAAGLPDSTTATYLRVLADALDAQLPALPALCVVPVRRPQ